MATAVLPNAAGKTETQTYEEFLRQYDGEFAEWEGGTVVPMSPVTYSHQDISNFLSAILRLFLEDNGSGSVLSAPFQMRLRAINRGREPDIAVVLRENLSRITPTFLDGPADLVVEIVSPDSEVRDRKTKFAEYEKCGVSEYWILDPRTMIAEFYVRDQATGKYAAKSADASGIYESAVLPGFWIRVAWLWSNPLPTVRHVLKMWEAGLPASV